MKNDLNGRWQFKYIFDSVIEENRERKVRALLDEIGLGGRTLNSESSIDFHSHTYSIVTTVTRGFNFHLYVS